MRSSGAKIQEILPNWYLSLLSEKFTQHTQTVDGTELIPFTSAPHLHLHCDSGVRSGPPISNLHQDSQKQPCLQGFEKQTPSTQLLLYPFDFVLWVATLKLNPQQTRAPVQAGSTMGGGKGLWKFLRIKQYSVSSSSGTSACSLQDWKAGFWRDMHTPMFTAVLFTAAKMGKQLRCSTDGQKCKTYTVHP